MSDYRFTDQDIDGMMLFLKTHHPDYATEEWTVNYLQFIKDLAREVSISDLTNEKLEHLFELFLRSKNENI